MDKIYLIRYIISNYGILIDILNEMLAEDKIQIRRGDSSFICSRTKPDPYRLLSKYKYYELLLIPNLEFNYKTKCLCISNRDKTHIKDIDIDVLNNMTYIGNITKVPIRRYL